MSIQEFFTDYWKKRQPVKKHFIACVVLFVLTIFLMIARYCHISLGPLSFLTAGFTTIILCLITGFVGITYSMRCIVLSLEAEKIEEQQKAHEELEQLVDEAVARALAEQRPPTE